MITLNPIELFMFVTKLLNFRITIEMAGIPKVLVAVIQLMLILILDEAFIELRITLFLIYIFINPQKRFD
ncbi:hypothetical protein [Flavobacterium oreochromis]|uniref:Uncharacterized protein n=1 Tax=Flavobacterium oreochromis TaxID=2906078 RepID=A0ABW8P9Z4_9FLAO|nr:hypothetical protein [Flavobacterium oreochromis]QYS85480.1 hypothetical protein JJC03_09605 [Flavobacterium oreochromis]